MKELIKLYEEYLDNSKEERTHEFLEKGEKKKVEYKGDFDGFMRWLKKRDIRDLTASSAPKTPIVYNVFF